MSNPDPGFLWLDLDTYKEYMSIICTSDSNGVDIQVAQDTDDRLMIAVAQDTADPLNDLLAVGLCTV